MTQAYLFPGQGSQKIGMGKDLYNEFALAKNRFNTANTILNRDLKSIVFDGSEEELRETHNTQPALFLVESILYDVLSEIKKIPPPTVCLGHSLGEYSALFAAGAFSFDDGLKLVAKRGELMAEVGNVTKGTMAAIIGLTYEKIQKITTSITEGIVVPANINSPEQIVISGTVEAVNSACKELKQIGAKLVKILPVSGAFHSPLMQPAAKEFKKYLTQFTFRDTKIPVISNVTAHGENKADIIKDLLVQQLISPVRWVESITWLRNNSITHGIEIGPGSVLKGLTKKCCKEIEIQSCYSVETLQALTTL